MVKGSIDSTNIARGEGNARETARLCKGYLSPREQRNQMMDVPEVNTEGSSEGQFNYLRYPSGDESSAMAESIEEDNTSISSQYESSVSSMQSNCDDKVDQSDEDSVTSLLSRAKTKLTSGVAQGKKENKSQLENQVDKFISKVPKVGMNIANFNMAGNFDVSLAANLMIDRSIHLLAVQEHLPWSKELSPEDSLHIKMVCNENEFRV